jgi:branched-chain amino acid transport system permease protein
MGQNNFSETIKWGLIAGIVALSASMIGLVQSFDLRDIISDLLTLGQVLLFSAALVIGFLVANKQDSVGNKVVHGLIAGIFAAIPLIFLIILVGAWATIRDSFINVSPDLINIITLGNAENPLAGGMTLIGIFAALGIVGALFSLIPHAIRYALLSGFGWALGIGLMSEILINVLRSRLSRDTLDSIFGSSGIKTTPFFIIAILLTIFTYWWNRGGKEQYAQVKSRLSPAQAKTTSRIGFIVMLIFFLVLPSFLGVYLSEIFNNVGLYILMGLGLNIAVGLAGLLDLGYVTNFAVGAYVMALLTSTSEFGLQDPINFWIAVPIAVFAAMLSGFVFALPVLRMRGDYLAIATLGFGEIVRVLVRSDALKEFIGGAQGILAVPKASIGGFIATVSAYILDPINNFLSRWDLGILGVEKGEIVFGTPPQLYYLIVVACLLMLFVSRRLNNSSTGRRWMAMREDEDVAAAMGINTTNAKVIAFTLSAASGGLAGAIFAAKVGSIFPQSFQILISINVLSLIIVGGIGSVPGIVIGAFALIGIPEFLREFAEFRLLLYGVALIVMMLIRPEGLWPSEVQRRELRKEEDEIVEKVVPAGRT